MRRFSMRTLAVALGFLSIIPGAPGAVVWAQTAQQMTRIGPEGVVLGETCTRRTDRFAGVIKVDACGRWYCGRVDINDITVLNPRFAETMKCSWELVDDKCKCRRQ